MGIPGTLQESGRRRLWSLLSAAQLPRQQQCHATAVGRSGVAPRCRCQRLGVSLDVSGSTFAFVVADGNHLRLFKEKPA